MTELKPASLTRPAFNPTSAASSAVADSTRPMISAARSASRRPAGVSRIPRPTRWTRRAPTCASSLDSWWLIDGWVYRSSFAAAVTEPCRRTASMTRSCTRVTMHKF
ncbi:hypothetical protein Airi02_036230 [Actinoallomurus iriomotensis]|uniref:Uncharacterized protein n=1 Tax=Actinoallomurus iriomotensis TaxID=478107 RepID=A0A9W6S242_9ACTN|nr:hypothetical protein Airi02_036230 [Actinoallomurus iriomotensis]